MTERRTAVTGWQRKRKTTLSVKIGDVFARGLITAGGMGTIAAVTGVAIFLVWIAAPLFFPGQVTGEQSYERPWDNPSPNQPLHMAIDDHRSLGWVMMPDGQMHVFLLNTGERVYQQDLFPDRNLTTASFGERRGDAIFGFESGEIQRGDITFQTEYFSPEEMPNEYRDMRIGENRAYEDGVVFLTPRNQFRYRYVDVELQEAAEMDEPSPIRHLTHTVRSSGPVVVNYTEDGRLFMSSIRERENLLTGEVRTDLDERELPFTLPEGRDAPDHLQIVGLGDNIFVMWEDGLLLRYDIRDRDNPRVVETLDLVPEEGESLTTTGFMIGRHSLVTGDSLGRTRVWFRISARDAERAEEAGVVEQMQEPDPDELTEIAEEAAEDDQIEGDGLRMVNAHELSGPTDAPAVTSLGRSLRSRLMSVGYEDGTVRLFQVTANNLVLETQLEGGQPVEQLTMAPRDNAIVGSAAAGIRTWHVNIGHAAITPRSIFLPVWYEDYTGPQHMWQSSAATDDFEPKYGLVPLIFGTLKATTYAMLFALPLALLAAIYSSEFLSRKVRAKVKPAIEMMVALPTVVLGFLAALVLAPVIGRFLPAVLLAFATVPLTYLIGAYLWQLLPYRWHVVLSKWRFTVIMAVTPIGLLAAFFGGPWMEALLFSGDTQNWLRGRIGTGAPGWFILLLPLSAFVTAMVFSFIVNPRLRERGEHWPRSRFALLDMGKFLGGLTLTVGLATVGGFLLAGYPWLLFDEANPVWKFDPRGALMIGGLDFSPIGAYAQRNALVVGFIMGFGVIPVIYTIAEDALSSVPNHLRSASLGAGATPWQTAVRLIIPTAMSGLFSATMIGLGRTVGETMIVLMATGNTPLLEMNIFNGFRTLSANIAVELSEASRGGTHYRMLFLAALILFAMTFVINTMAEIVRLRFRRRAYQL